MAEKKFLKGSEERMLILDFYELCQSIWIPENTEEYCNDAADRLDAFFEKYKTAFAKDLCKALLNEIERKSGGGYKK